MATTENKNYPEFNPGLVDLKGKQNKKWQRIDDLIIFLLGDDRFLQAKRGKQLERYVMMKYKVTDRTARTYLSEVRKEIRKLIRLKGEEAKKSALRSRDYLLDIAKQKKNYRLALQIMKDRDELLGLYPVSGDDAIPFKPIKNKPNFSKLTDRAIAKIKSAIRNEQDVNSILNDPANYRS